ncbi:MAG: Lrp/AsnC family transcriptional regulator [Thermoplasmata archaeon]|nr:Lrp/AsnC family transcriptional regulator [Thermoplasmata archaeon]
MVGLGRQLTDKERDVFCGLVTHPDMNDRELSSISCINLSTVTAIRRRLHAANYFYRARIPMVQYIGAELLTVAYGEINNTIPREKRNRFCDAFAKEHENLFLFFTSDDFGVIMLISKNYTEVKQDVDALQHFLSTNKIIESKPWQYVLFPFEVSSLINYFDYSYAFKHLLCDTHYSVPDIDLKYKRFEKRNLTTKEKIALIGLVENPELPDNTIAKKIGISRQTLSNMRQRFEEEDLIRNMNMPNIRMLGSGILAFSHILFNPEILLEDRKNGVKLVLEGSPVIFVVSGSFESTLMHLIRDYEDFNMFKNKLLSYYASKNFLRGEPMISLLPLNSIVEHKRFDFSGILKNLLD